MNAKSKLHVFHENPDSQLWVYGRSNNLTREEVERIKKLLPPTDKILVINFANPEDYKYPQQENTTLPLYNDE